jgi:hypothetical protein
MERIHKIAWRNISEEHNLNRHYYKNLQTHVILKPLLVEEINYFLSRVTVTVLKV